MLYLLPLIASILFAIQDIIIKKIGRSSISNLQMLFLFSLNASIGTFLIFPIRLSINFSFVCIVHLLLLGICSVLSQLFLFFAFRKASLTSLAPVRYVEYIIQMFCGYIFFSEIPDGKNVICALVIAICTLCTLH